MKLIFDKHEQRILNDALLHLKLHLERQIEDLEELYPNDPKLHELHEQLETAQNLSVRIRQGGD